jgi:hypothetical protein
MLLDLGRIEGCRQAVMTTRMGLLLPTLVLISCVAVTQEPEAVTLESGEVRFELVGPGDAALVVPVLINGKGPFPLVLDTGTPLTCVDQSLANELDLQEAADTVAIGGAVGGTNSVRLVRLESIEVGTAKSAGLIGCVVDLGPMLKSGVEVKGLLGLNFLKAYHVTIDFDNRTIRLEPGESRP